nr:hypothetical protein Iba_scaffold2853CG0310 [Ipomoea batatas]
MVGSSGRGSKRLKGIISADVEDVDFSGGSLVVTMDSSGWWWGGVFPAVDFVF